MAENKHVQSMLRLFLAVNLPDELRAQLDSAIAPCRSTAPEARWTRADSWHLTLVFLGERPAAQIPALREQVTSACRTIAPFPIWFAGTGCFPSASHPRVLWAGLAGGATQLIALQRAVSRALVRAALARPEEHYIPHLTLARLPDHMEHTNRADLGRRWSAFSLPPLPEVPVQDVHLMQSELGRDGARYTAICTIPLAGGLDEMMHP